MVGSMIRGAAAAVLAASVLALSGCGSEANAPSEPAPASEPSPAPAPAPAAELRVRDVDNAYIFKSTFEGTELTCLSKGSYGSTTCNWELWNKMRESK
jgi:hypothetical protein